MSELNLVLLGSPGSGKGTQSERLQEDFRLPYYATGDILRAAVRNGTELGAEAREYMDRVPRTIAQGEALDAKLNELGRALTAAVLIDVPDEEVVRRLSGRRVCVKNGHIFHMEFDPPKNEGVCDICGSRLEIREDDKPEVVRHRLGTYHEKTEPLVAYYEEQGILRRVDGLPSPDEVSDRIRALLATLRMEEEL